jgi:hypothetical protein
MREFVEVWIGDRNAQCSGFFKWHSQVYTRPKNDTELTRDDRQLQKLGDGWIRIPRDLNNP